MKKWVFVVAGVLLVAVVLIDVFIPSTLTVSRVELLKCRAVAAWPFLSEGSRWEGWWPDSATRKDFHIQRLSYHVVHIGIRDPRGELSSQLRLLPVGIQDSTLLQWETQLHCGWSPLDRIRQYRRAAGLKNVMDRVLAKAGSFLSKKENLYGVGIKIEMLPDTLLIATRMEKNGLPTTEDIYAQIAKLSRYVSAMHSKATNHPMVNIAPEEGHPGRYKLLAAVPVDTRLENKGDLFFMRLIPWRYLACEVKGGPGTVDMAFRSMDKFIRDYQLTVMAIPFQMLVTDRRAEPDSTRWVTRIYYPIF
ncbi:MAG TPA: GyrI-like domain-containing protein [Puia sp.]|uniref:GyrI-like domain-containing protein n=1 Tax=Puia sp. TaxID=2045100 RepID=UPI002CE97C41|nr:GyrI-like domain-containing protein [Puia sp.]HVU94899.1 GyrI-like domain-containing protein [Puia sp.]